MLERVDSADVYLLQVKWVPRLPLFSPRVVLAGGRISSEQFTTDRKLCQVTYAWALKAPGPNVGDAFHGCVRGSMVGKISSRGGNGTAGRALGNTPTAELKL